MKHSITLFLLVLAGLFWVISQAVAQQPDSIWSQTYGGDTTDACFSSVQTSDGGYILAGYTKSFGAGQHDFWLAKTDADGDSLWSSTFGGDSIDICYSVQQTSDGGYILAGHTRSYGVGDYDFYLVKTDANGVLQWDTTYGGSNADYCFCVRETFDGGYVLAGWTKSYGAGDWDGWLVKTNSTGTKLWSQTHGSLWDDRLYWVEQTPDSGFALAGFYTFGGGDPDVWLVKTNSNGVQQWDNTFGGYHWDQGRCVALTSDDGYIVTGYTETFGAGGGDFYVIKTDSQGDEEWSHTYGGTDWEQSESVQQTVDGGYVIAGYSQTYGAGEKDFYLVKVDADGIKEWDKTFGGSENDYCYSVEETSDLGYALAGYTNSSGAGYADFWMVKMAYDESPVITSITDVGNDQGRQVRIRWDRCIYDGYWLNYVIENYNIYRRIDQYFLADDGKNGRSGLDWPPGEWDYVTTVPAEGEENYATIVPTLADSTSEGIYWSVYFVRAKTPDPLVHFSSEVDSGYSVDNLPPDETVMTAMVPTSPNTVKLQWQEVTTGGGGQLEQGGVWYRVYGSTDPMFTPAPENLLTTTQNLEFEHNIGANDKYFYIIQASDDH